MDTTTEQPNPERPKRAGRFQKGVSGNPKGKPKGKTAKTVLAEKLLSKDIDAVIEVIRKAALDGDIAAAKLIVDKLIATPKSTGRMLSGFQLPILRTAEDVAAALAVVIQCVGNSLLSLEEADALSALITRQGDALAASDFEKRLIALEDHAAPKQIGYR
jgi:hypothetical protein